MSSWQGSPCPCPLRGMERRHHCWRLPTLSRLRHTHTKCHKTNRTEKEMRYLNFHNYFSPLLPLLLLIYFLACFPQAVLVACICFLSSFTPQQPGSFQRAPTSAPHFSGCPEPRPISTLPRARHRREVGKVGVIGVLSTGGGFCASCCMEGSCLTARCAGTLRAAAHPSHASQQGQRLVAHGQG